MFFVSRILSHNTQANDHANVFLVSEQLIVIIAWDQFWGRSWAGLIWPGADTFSYLDPILALGANLAPLSLWPYSLAQSRVSSASDDGRGNTLWLVPNSVTYFRALHGRPSPSSAWRIENLTVCLAPRPIRSAPWNGEQQGPWLIRYLTGTDICIRLIHSVIALSHEEMWYRSNGPDPNTYHTRLNVTNHYTSAIQMLWLPNSAYTENDSVSSRIRYRCGLVGVNCCISWYYPWKGPR